MKKNSSKDNLQKLNPISIPKKIILLIVSAYIVYFIITPPFTLHDEPAHVKIIAGVSQGHYMLTGKYRGNYDDLKELEANKKLLDALKYIDHPDQIPTFTTVSKLKVHENDYNTQDIYSHQAYSPPFYYLIGGIFFYAAQITDNLLGQFYILRLTSTLFYFGTVFIAWKLLLVYFSNKKIAAAILLFFAINPLVLKMGIGINPDIAVTFFSLCFLYILLRLSSKSLQTKSVIKLSLLSAVATLSKVSGIFTNAVFMLYLFLTHKLSKKTFRKLLLFEGIFAAVTLPWFAFVYSKYHTFFPEPFSSMCPKASDPVVVKVIETFTDLRFTFMQYSGFMGEGWPHPFKWFFVTFVILFIVLLIVGLIYIVRQKRELYKTTIIYLLPMFVLLLYLSAQYRIKDIACDVPGRYMLPIYLILCIFVYWGLFVLTKNEARAAYVLKAFAVFHFLFVLFTVLLIRYYV